MKRISVLLFFIFSSHSLLLKAQVNPGFEVTIPGAYTASNAVSGWTVTSQNVTSCGPVTNWLPGSPEFSVVTTPILTAFAPINPFGFTPIGGSPLGGQNIARLNDQSPSGLKTRIANNFPVTAANCLFEYAFAGLWEDGSHICCEQAGLTINLYDCSNNLVGYWSSNFNANGASCTNGAPGFSLTNNWTWTGWQMGYMDLTPYMGSCVTVEVITGDCIYGTHAGSVYFDARTVPPLIGAAYSGGLTILNAPNAVNFCQGASQAQISAPLGYTAYQWYAPGANNVPVPISPLNGGNTQMVTIPNPVAGTVYTVQLVTATNYTFTQTDTLNYSTLSITGIGSSSTCINGASGSATVLASGSGNGYTYSWYGQGPNTLGTSSVVPNLSPSVYVVSVSANGSPGCGTATGTVTVGTAPYSVITIIKPFCGNTAYLSAPATGSNFRWYSASALIPAAQGGTASAYTASNVVNGASYYVAYASAQGCQDSVQFLLSQTPPGSMNATGVSYACQGAPNATVNLVLNPAFNAAGVNSFSVFSTSALPSPQYTSGISFTTLNSYTASGLSAGTYSAIGFDGACTYSTSFAVSDYVFDYALSAISSTVCAGNNMLAAISFTSPISPGQYSFQWSPLTWINGGAVNANNIAVQITPATPINSITTTLYSVTVVPTIANCPLTKTLSVTAVNLNPAISPVADFCTNAAASTISVTPAGGTFSTSSGSWLGSTSGMITPSLAAIGTNTFTYQMSVGTCTASATASFAVSQFNSGALTTSSLNVCSALCMNLMSLVQGTTSGAWAGAGVASNTFCPSVVALGAYTFSYNTASSPNPTLCPDVQTLSVMINPLLTPNITPPQAFCTNLPVFAMSASPAGGIWSSAIPQLVSPAGLVDPANAPAGVSTLSYAITSGPCVYTTTTSISANQFNPATLTASVLSLCISNLPLNLATMATGTVNGAWSGAGVTNPVFNPVLASGNYVVYYNTTSVPNPLACPDSQSLTITVSNPATPTLAAAGPYCSTGAATQLSALPGTGFFTPTPYLTAGGLLTPSLCAIGTNTVQYSNGTSTCSTQDTKQIVIEAYVPATLTGSVGNQCSTNPAVDLRTITQYTTGGWAGTGVAGTFFNPGNAGAGTFVLTYTTGSVPSGLCPAQTSLAVNVFICTGLDELKGSGASLKIYPNPTTGNVFVESPTDFKVIIYSELGSMLFEGSYKSGKQDISLESFNGGIYLVKCLQNNNATWMKLVKTD